MNIKYYDLLSTTIVGVVIVAIVKNIFSESKDINGVSYIAFGYLVGYFINAVGSFLEKYFYKMIKGRPSDNLLTLVEGQDWTGYKKVKFYEAEKVIEMLKKELNDPNASTEKMFECAMRKVNEDENSRVSIFNAQYALSRTVLTATLIGDILFFPSFCKEWEFWLVAIILLIISSKRFKERGYYYAREVLNEYLKSAN